MVFTNRARYFFLPQDDTYYCLNCNEIFNFPMNKSLLCADRLHQIITYKDYELKSELDKRKKAHGPTLFFGQELKVDNCAINCDASLRKSQKLIGCGIVVRTYKLEFIYAETQYIRSTGAQPIDFEQFTSTTAEIKTLYRALEIANDYHTMPNQWNRYLIFSDSTNTVNAFNYGELAYRKNDEKEISLDSINECRVLVGLNKWDDLKEPVEE